ncbi:MAG: hypothetical protein ACD_40C00267G0001 [uncultured bacterium]|nr:MAG: hypothetical protein ACD_40C00267G0001 [uncultured bacterium]KKU25617.1 MAG: hypothetical protein UX37_C0017G0009 [Microgenomates group bacterium GW2011_GWA2_46_16]
MNKQRKHSPQNKWSLISLGIFAIFFVYATIKMIFAPVAINEMTVSNSYGTLSKPLISTPPNPPPGCSYQKVECINAPCDPVLICSSSTPSQMPRSTCRPRPACLDSTPRCMIAETEDMCPPSTKPTPSPKPFVSSTPTPIGTGIATFNASKPCGSASFLSISFTCKDGRTKEIAVNTCTDFVSAMSIAQDTCSKEIK